MLKFQTGWTYLILRALMLPMLAAQASEATPAPTTGVWNTFFGLVNSLECTNAGSVAVALDVSLRAGAGGEINRQRMTVPATGALQMPLNSLLPQNHYGTIQLTVEGQHSDQLDCITNFHKLPDTPRERPIDFAFAIPLRSPIIGGTRGIYNSMNPSGGGEVVWNWLSIVNPGVALFSARIVERDLEGSIVAEHQLWDLSPGERRDIPLGHPRGQRIGIYELLPLDVNQPYLSFLTRYGFTAGKPSFAFNLVPQQGTCDSISLPASTMGDALNWAEIANISPATANATLEIFDQSGLSRGRVELEVESHRQRHVLVNPYLGPENLGYLKANCRPPIGDARLIVQSAFYGRRPGTSLVDWAYASQTQLELPTKVGKVATVFNRQFGAFNWLKLRNGSLSRANVNTTAFRSDGIVAASAVNGLPAAGSLDISLHDLARDLELGRVESVIVESGEEVSEVRAELIRVFPRFDGGLGYIMNLPVRLYEKTSGDGISSSSSSSALSSSTAASSDSTSSALSSSSSSRSSVSTASSSSVSSSASSSSSSSSSGAPETADSCAGTPTLRVGETVMTTVVVTREGVGFSFALPALVGCFASRDYWVLGPVILSGTMPEREIRTYTTQSGLASRMINGLMVNPNDPRAQALDERAARFNPALVPALPLTLIPGDMVIKGESEQPGSIGVRFHTRRAGVLSVLGELPPANGATVLRPGVYGPRRVRTLHPVGPLQSRLVALPRLDMTPELQALAPSLQSALQKLDLFQNDTMNATWTSEQLRPSLQADGYGALQAMRVSESFLRGTLFRRLDDDPALLRQLALRIAQHGVDVISFIQHGGRYEADGGHGHGRAAPAVLAALLLDSEELKESLRTASTDSFAESDYFQLAEDGQTVIWGDSATNLENEYWDGVIMQGQGGKAVRDPYRMIDGGYRPSIGYQYSGNSTAHYAVALLLEQVPEILQFWDGNKVREYARRWRLHGAHTAPDHCAPPLGYCSPQSENSHALCSFARDRIMLSANGSSLNAYNADCSTVPNPLARCLAGVCSESSPLEFRGLTCDAELGPVPGSDSACGTSGRCEFRRAGPLAYGVAYGPDAAGGCVLDNDRSDGTGRFPALHGQNRDLGSFSNPFAREAYRTFGSP